MVTIVKFFTSTIPKAVNIAELAMQCLEKINEGEENLGHVNIIIAGKTGVGKSTLINAAFRENLAETGIGLPVTRSCNVIESNNIPIRIYDTVGLELTEKTKNETIQNIHDLIETKINQGDHDQFIHCMWYCVNSTSDRLEKPEQELINKIAVKIPVILVITKSYLKKHSKKFADVLKKYNLDTKDISIVLAQDYNEEDFNIEAYGVEELLEKTFEILPETVHDAWINAQSSLKLKHNQSMQIIKQTILAAFGSAMIPIPVADALMLIPIQVAMFTRITNIYGVEMTRNKMTRILFIMLGTTGAATAGKFLASSLLKFIPGLNFVDGVINSVAATSITFAFGMTYIYIMESLLTGAMTENDLVSDEGLNKIKSILNENLKKIYNNDLVKKFFGGNAKVTTTTKEISEEEFDRLTSETFDESKKFSHQKYIIIDPPPKSENIFSRIKKFLPFGR